MNLFTEIIKKEREREKNVNSVFLLFLLVSRHPILMPYYLLIYKKEKNESVYSMQFSELEEHALYTVTTVATF